MCVRCGTGRVAWCTDPMRHGESAEPVSPGEPPVKRSRPAETMTPRAAAQILDKYLEDQGIELTDDEPIPNALRRIWDLVLEGE